MSGGHRLFSFRRCPYAIRARMALASAELPYERIEVSLRDKPAELLALSPKGTVPVLQCTDGSVLEESLDIIRWALAQNDPQRWLAATQARCEADIARNDGPFKQKLDAYKYYRGADPSGAFAEAQVHLDSLEARLVAGAEHLGAAGKESLADLCLMPFIRQFARCDEPRFAAALPALNTWLTRWLNDPRFTSVMQR